MNAADPTPTVDPRDQFNRQASHYDDQWNAWNRESLDWILSRVAWSGRERVLDVATGGGFTALACAPLAGEVVGLDVAEAMREAARRRAAELGLRNTLFVPGPAERLPFPGERFDVVTCRIAPHHFRDVPAFLREAHRVLRCGGRLLVADSTVPDESPEAAAWQNEVERLRDPSHARNLSPGEWRGLLETAGYRLEEMEFTGGGITIPLGAWLRKAGCEGERADAVRARFRDAPPEAVQLYGIAADENGETVFTWRRVLLHALRPRKIEPAV